MTTIVTLKEAREQGLTRYFTGKPCKNGHVSERFVSCAVCCECEREKTRKRYEDNPDYSREKARKWREDNPEYFRKWYEANAEKKRETVRKYQQANPDKVNANGAKRRAAKLQRTPPWLTQDELEDISDFYAIARLFRVYTGQEYHVDHIVPLQGKKISGLHVPWNLTVLEAKDNLSKRNSFELEI